MIVLEKCNICPHKCLVNRIDNQHGRCRAGKDVKVALASIHKYEEPCISGGSGSGTIFFSNCNLQCVYCQNFEISQEGKGKEVSIDELADIMLKQQEKGADNINLVTPTMYAIQIVEAIKKAKVKGLNIPIIYNTNGYEAEETVDMLNGYIDVYLPDLKYYSNELAKKYSNVNNYFDTATKAISKMIEQVRDS